VCVHVAAHIISHWHAVDIYLPESTMRQNSPCDTVDNRCTERDRGHSLGATRGRLAWMSFSTPAGRRTARAFALAGAPLTLCLSSGCNMVGVGRGGWGCTVGRVGDLSWKVEGRRSKSAGPSSLEPLPSSGRLGLSSSGVPAPTSGGGGMGTRGDEGIDKGGGKLTLVMLLRSGA